MALFAGPAALAIAGSASDAVPQAPEFPSPDPEAPRLLSVEKTWDRAPHNAFTDLIRFQDQWFCTFREADGHVRGDGRIRVIVSNDAKQWESAALLVEDGIDLRDPKISITPDNRLMIVAGGSVYRDGKLVGRQPRVAFSSDGRDWTDTQRILSEGEWLWRVTWNKGRGYGVSYSTSGDWNLKLFATDNGTDYSSLGPIKVSGRANETALRFDDRDRMIALIRREGSNTHGLIGVSEPPYEEWSWHETAYRLGGPNFVILPNGDMWAAGRYYPGGAKTVLARFGPKTYEPVLTLPSGGDCSYPGLVWHDGLLWMSYYSSHEGKTSIYLARIELP